MASNIIITNWHERSGDHDKGEYFLAMGMMDTFDYIYGCHPAIPDDNRNIEHWLSI